MTAAPTAPPGSDRRPIRSRELPLFKRIAGGLARAGVSANAISVAGMVAGIAAGAAFAATGRIGGSWARALWLAGAVLIQLRLIANMLDGMVAIASGRASALGELYNEVPDRVSDAATLIGLGYAVGGKPELGYVAAAFAIFVAYTRVIGKSAGAGSDFRGPMAKQQRMFLATLTGVFMALAPAAWARGWCPADPAYGPASAVLAIIILGCAVTAIRRLRRAAATLRAMNP